MQSAHAIIDAGKMMDLSMMMFAPDEALAMQLPMDDMLSLADVETKRRPAEVSDDEGLYSEWDALWRDDELDLMEFLEPTLSVSPEIKVDRKRKSQTAGTTPPKMPRKNNALSEAKWAEERMNSTDPTMPEKRPVGISLASGSSSGWRLRISGTQLGHYATAQQAWEHYPRTAACKAKLTREHQGKKRVAASLDDDDILP